MNLLFLFNLLIHKFAQDRQYKLDSGFAFCLGLGKGDLFCIKALRPLLFRQKDLSFFYFVYQHFILENGVFT